MHVLFNHRISTDSNIQLLRVANLGIEKKKLLEGCRWVGMAQGHMATIADSWLWPNLSLAGEGIAHSPSYRDEK